MAWGEAQTGGRTDGGDGRDGDSEGGAAAAATKKKEERIKRTRTLITGGIGAPRKDARLRKHCGCTFQKRHSLR